MIYHLYFESGNRAYNLKLSDNPKDRQMVRILLSNSHAGAALLHLKNNALKLVSYQGTDDDKKVYIESFTVADNNLSIFLSEKKEENDLELPSTEVFRFNKDKYSLEIRNNGSDDSEAFNISFYYGDFIGNILINCIPSDHIYNMVLDFGSEASQMLISRHGNNDFNRGESELFSNCAEHFYGIESGTIRERTYDQQEEGDNELFRSIFFLPKNIDGDQPSEGSVFAKPGEDDPLLDFITKRDDSEKGQRLPNIKISYLSGEAPDEVDPATLHQAIVMRFIHEAVMEVKDRENGMQRSEQCAIRMYILVPNVMEQAQVSNFIQSIQNNLETDAFRSLLPESLKNAVFDIRSYSESDASFIYWLENPDEPITEGEYLIIDVGKGTTDFSIIKVEDGQNAVSIYRSGFVGAGNAITYAMFENYIASMGGINHCEEYTRKILTEAEDALLYRLENALEDSKRHYGTVNPTRLNNRFGNGTNVETMIEMIANQGPIDDNRGIILSTIHDIIEKIVLNVKETKFKKVILSGRAFKYKPFLDETISVLSRLYHLERETGIVYMDRPKKGCLRGPLSNIRINKQSDIIGIPVKVDITSRLAEENELKKQFNKILKEIKENRNIVPIKEHQDKWWKKIGLNLKNIVLFFCHHRGLKITKNIPFGGDTDNQIINLEAENKDIIEMMRGELDTETCDINTRFYISDDQYVLENTEAFEDKSYKLFFDGVDFYIRDDHSCTRLIVNNHDQNRGMLYESLFPYPYRILNKNYEIPQIKSLS